MTWFAALAQGAMFAALIGRWFGGDEIWRYMLWGAVGIPLLSAFVSGVLPRVATLLGFLLVGFWTVLGGYGAYAEPSLEAWEWIPALTFLGFCWGAAANAPLLQGASEWADQLDRQDAARRSAGAERTADSETARDRGAHDEEPPGSRECACRRTPASGWDVLGVEPGSPQSAIKRAFYERMQEYHPDKVAMLGKELRDLAEAKAKDITAAYEQVRRDRRS